MILWDTLAQSQPSFVAMRWLPRPSIQDKPGVGGLVKSFLFQTGTQPLQTLLVSDFPDSSSEPGCVWLPIKVLGLAALSAELLTAPTSLLWPEWIRLAKAVLSMCFSWGDGLRDRNSPFHHEMATPAGWGRASFSFGSFQCAVFSVLI